MTVTEPETATEAGAGTTQETRVRWRRLRDLGRFVDRRVTQLQRDCLDGKPDAVAKLARLRRGVGKEVGAIPDLWGITLEGIPANDFESDEPTYDERAAYTAITLYALHQQSRREGMHRPGQGLGTAVRFLRRQSPSADAVRRRFEAVGTATTFPEVVYHARGLITQLRAASIPLDYGVLADQLRMLQTGHADRVRLVWGRDFYRVTSDSPDDDPDSAAESASTPDEES